MKMKFRSMLLFVGAMILLFTFDGCSRVGDNLNDNGEDLCLCFLTRMTTQKSDTVSFCAEPFFQEPALSWEYSLDIQVRDGKIYINNILYEQVPSSIPPVILYSDGFLAGAASFDSIGKSQKLVDTLEAIKKSNSCYLLKTDEGSHYGKEICVYEIDTAYFFVNFNDNGQVMRIHRVPIG